LLFYFLSIFFNRRDFFLSNNRTNELEIWRELKTYWMRNLFVREPICW